MKPLRGPMACPASTTTVTTRPAEFGGRPCETEALAGYATGLTVLAPLTPRARTVDMPAASDATETKTSPGRRQT